MLSDYRAQAARPGATDATRGSCPRRTRSRGPVPHVPTKATVDNGETGRQDQRPCSPARTEESSVLHSVIRPLPSAIGDVDWAGARLYVISKGTRLRQAVPVSPEAIRVPDPLPRRRRRAWSGRAAVADPPRRDTSCDLLGHAVRVAAGEREAGGGLNGSSQHCWNGVVVCGRRRGGGGSCGCRWRSGRRSRVAWPRICHSGRSRPGWAAHPRRSAARSRIRSRNDITYSFDRRMV